MAYKQFKDPVYGYIDIPEQLCSDFIDTPGFQRLRRVSQTGYGPLYPSALHNRFVHSLGVFHLSNLAAKALDKSAKGLLAEEHYGRWQEALETFRLASLLHDFGHAPFSHAGESFYLLANENLENDLISAVDENAFTEDVRGRAKSDSAAPHEIMSALLALRVFDGKIKAPALFARCITGYKHLYPCEEFDHLENILIETLHSATIDVDRLDYLIRDAFVVGYDSIAIDYQRLLGGLRIVRVGKSRYERCFYRSALSVLENAIYARDLEKQWIQAHPVILYEQELVKNLIASVNAQVEKEGNRVFVEAALTEEGVELSESNRVRLLSDDDLIVLAKQRYDEDSLIAEYFNRGVRPHPVWKSEAQYRHLFKAQKTEQEAASVVQLESAMSDFIDLCEERRCLAVCDKDAMLRIEEDLGSLAESEREQWMKLKASRENQLLLLQCLEKFAVENNVPFRFAVLRIKGFASGFSAGDIGEEKIIFSDKIDSKWSSFSKVSSGLRAERETGKAFFVFSQRPDGVEIDASELAQCLIDAFA